jgi:4-hydroxybenzoate polyprenyltransferase
MFRIIAIVLCALIFMMFVLLFMFAQLRPVLYPGMLAIGCMLNVLMAAKHLTEGEKKGWLFLAGAVLCTFMILNHFLHFL